MNFITKISREMNSIVDLLLAAMFAVALSFPLAGSVEAMGGSANPTVWFKADVGITASSTVPSSVESWTDQASSITTTAVTADLPLLVTGGDRGEFNFNSYVNFTTDHAELQATGTADILAGGQGTILAVYSRESNGRTSMFNYRNSFGEGYSAGSYEGEMNGSRKTYGTPGARETALVGVHSDGVDFFGLDNGKKSLTNSNYNYNYTSTSSIALGGRGDGVITSRFVGFLGEIMVYSSALSDADRQEAESYLALKYGITLDNTDIDSMVDGDYVLGGTTVWDATTNADFHYDVFGIGNSSAFGLDQQASKSENLEAIVTISTEDDFESANTNRSASLDNGNFIVIGNNDQEGRAWSAINTVPRYRRLGSVNNIANQRTWKVQETGIAGEVFLQVNTAGSSYANIPAIPAAGGDSLYLLIDDDNVFSTTSKVVEMTVDDEDTNLWSTEVDFTDGEYFTFGYITNVAPIITSNGGGNTGIPNPIELFEGDDSVVTTASSTDADGDTVSYGLGGTDVDDFVIDSATGELRFASTTDFQNPTDSNSNNVYNIQIIATDEYGGQDTQNLNISVKEIVEPRTINVELITPRGDGDLGPFDINVTCLNGDSHDFSLEGGATTTFTYPAGILIDCSIDANLATTTQADFFIVKKGDNWGRNEGRIRWGNSNRVQDRTMTVTLTYTVNGVNEYVVEKRAPEGDGGLGPFDISVICANGDEYEFELGANASTTFQYEGDTRMDCRINETLTEAQDGNFKVRKGDSYGRSTGRLVARNSDTLAGHTLFVENTYSEIGLVDIDVEMITPNGDGDLGPFDVLVVCRNGDEFSFEMNGGETETFQYDAESFLSCRVFQTLNESQDGFFKVRKGDTYGGNNGVIHTGNSTRADGKSFTITNTYVPERVNEYIVEKRLTASSTDLGPYNVGIDCSNGDSYEFELDAGASSTFMYEAGVRMDCRISETLTTQADVDSEDHEHVQDGFYIIKKGDDFGSNNGRIVAHSDRAAGATFYVENTYVSEGVAEIIVEVQTPKGDLDLGPFDLSVSCNTDDGVQIYDFAEMSTGTTESFYLPNSQSVDCTVSQTLRSTQEGFFTVELTDDVSLSNGTIEALEAENVDGKKLIVINTAEEQAPEAQPDTGKEGEPIDVLSNDNDIDGDNAKLVVIAIDCPFTSTTTPALATSSPLTIVGSESGVCVYTIQDEQGKTATSTITLSPEDITSNTSSGSGGGSRYECRDKSATNYKTSGKSDPDLCEYADDEEEDEDSEDTQQCRANLIREYAPRSNTVVNRGQELLFTIEREAQQSSIGIKIDGQSVSTNISVFDDFYAVTAQIPSNSTDNNIIVELDAQDGDGCHDDVAVGYSFNRPVTLPAPLVTPSTAVVTSIETNNEFVTSEVTAIEITDTEVVDLELANRCLVDNRENYFSWGEVSNASYYHVEKKDSSSDTYTFIAQVRSNSYADTLLKEGESAYRVTAFDSLDEVIAQSNVVTCFMEDQPQQQANILGAIDFGGDTEHVCTVEEPYHFWTWLGVLAAWLLVFVWWVARRVVMLAATGQTLFQILSLVGTGIVPVVIWWWFDGCQQHEWFPWSILIAIIGAFVYSTVADPKNYKENNVDKI